jgi:hypothetical protein
MVARVGYSAVAAFGPFPVITSTTVTMRHNRGAVSVVDPFNSQDIDLNVGRTQFGGGLRLRF